MRNEQELFNQSAQQRVAKLEAQLAAAQEMILHHEKNTASWVKCCDQKQSMYLELDCALNALGTHDPKMVEGIIERLKSIESAALAYERANEAWMHLKPKNPRQQQIIGEMTRTKAELFKVLRS